VSARIGVEVIATANANDIAPAIDAVRCLAI